MVTVNPQGMWKKLSSQSGIGKVTSQVLVIGGGRVDGFVRQFFVQAMSKVQILKFRSDKHRAHNLLKPGMCTGLR